MGAVSVVGCVGAPMVCGVGLWGCGVGLRGRWVGGGAGLWGCGVGPGWLGLGAGSGCRPGVGLFVTEGALSIMHNPNCYLGKRQDLSQICGDPKCGFGV